MKTFEEKVFSMFRDFAPDLEADLRNSYQHTLSAVPIKIALWGPYSSGKSSLMKRLLVDSAKTIPDWLTISGGRETFDVNSVELAPDLILQDTPGLMSSEEQHNSLTQTALTMVDVFVLVVPPQLLTGDKAMIEEVLSGAHFGLSPSALPTECMLFVVNRMDEGGIDPAEDIEGYQSLAKRKRAEFETLLTRNGLCPPFQIFAVSADPFQLVTNSPQATRSNYDENREWDGIDRLMSAIAALPSKKAALRRSSLTRFWGYSLLQLERILLEDQSRKRSALEDLDNTSTRSALWSRRLGALIEKARADLERRMQDEALAAMRRYVDVEKLREDLDHRLGAAAKLWWQNENADLENLAKEIQVDFTTSYEQVGERVWSAAFSYEEQDVKTVDLDDFRKKTIKFAPLLKTALDAYLQSDIGMSLKDAKAEIEKRKTFFERFASGKFKDAKQLEKAERYVKNFDVLVNFGPLFWELTNFGVDIYNDKEKRDAAEANRKALRKELYSSIEKFTSDTVKAWSEQANELYESLESNTRANARNKDALLKHLQRISHLLSSIQSLRCELAEG